MGLQGRILVISVALAALGGCVAPRALREVATPRDGAPIRGQFCLVYSQRYEIDLGGFEALHPFDIKKYQKIYLKLVEDGLVRPADVFVPGEITRDELEAVHTPEYIESLKRPDVVARDLEVGLIALLPRATVERGIVSPFRCATGGTLLAARLALRHGVAVNLAGGYNHAAPDHGGGFNLFADIPIAARVLQREGQIQRALLIDLDAHQGDGTALSCAADDALFTFDMYEAGIYPRTKRCNDLNVPLDSGTDDATYLELLRANLGRAFDAARPDIVLYNGGADVLAEDPLTGLALTIDGLVERDRIVFDEARRRRVPIAMVLGGGYSKNAWIAQYRSVRGLIEAGAGD